MASLRWTWEWDYIVVYCDGLNRSAQLCNPCLHQQNLLGSMAGDYYGTRSKPGVFLSRILDDAKIWTRALSADEVRKEYRSFVVDASNPALVLQSLSTRELERMLWDISDTRATLTLSYGAVSNPWDRCCKLRCFYEGTTNGSLRQPVKPQISNITYRCGAALTN